VEQKANAELAKRSGTGREDSLDTMDSRGARTAFSLAKDSLKRDKKTDREFLESTGESDSQTLAK